jgi:hypothetical protein
MSTLSCSSEGVTVGGTVSCLRIPAQIITQELGRLLHYMNSLVSHPPMEHHRDRGGEGLETLLIPLVSINTGNLEFATDPS